MCDSAPRKVKPAFPSGLVNNWEVKLNDKKLKAPFSKGIAVPQSKNEQRMSKLGALLMKMHLLIFLLLWESLKI